MRAVKVKSLRRSQWRSWGLYLLFTAQRGAVLIASGNIAGILLGAGLLLLPAVGAWALVREVIFGARIQRMAQELDAQGKLPEDTLPRSPSGRVDREAASVELEKICRCSRSKSGQLGSLV